MSLPWYEILLRLGLATLCGLLVGIERERRHRPAGIKTHILVCVGAALVSLIQLEMINESIRQVQANPSLSETLKSDFGRLGAQVISGIGFLGAGTILRERGTIKGLTTAATLWMVACVGLAVGMGYYEISVMAIALTMIVLIILHLIQNQLLKVRSLKRIDILISNKRDAMNYINDYCALYNIVIENISLNDLNSHLENDSSDKINLIYTYNLILPRTITINDVIKDLQMNEYILSATVPSDNLLE